jgi:uncharacterized low-complexity protein
LANYIAGNEKTEERRPISDIQWLHCAKKTILGIVSKYIHTTSSPFITFHICFSVFVMAIVHLFHLTKASSFHLANVAQTTQSQVENEERIHSKGNPVFHNTRASKDADTGCQGPCDENKIDGNSSNRVELKCGEECCDDEWEEGISDYADGLSKGADGLLATIHREEGQQFIEKRGKSETYIFPPSNLI